MVQCSDVHCYMNASVIVKSKPWCTAHGKEHSPGGRL